MEESDSLIEEKITKQKGMTRVELQCWVSLVGEEESVASHRRKISEFSKVVKKLLYEQREALKDNYEYFVDVDIRDSPSTFAFLSLGVTFVKKTNVTKIELYPKILRETITNFNYFRLFKNGKKKKNT